DLCDGGEADGVVLTGEDGLGHVQADLGRVDVEGGDHLHVAHVVPPQGHVHETGHTVARFGLPVVGQALQERAGAVANACDRHADGAHEWTSFLDGAGAAGEVAVGAGVLGNSGGAGAAVVLTPRGRGRRRGPGGLFLRCWV